VTRSFDSREGLHGQDRDGLVLREIVHARFAGQARTPVDFGGTRTALAGFAVPANGEIGSEVPLNVMKRVENDHAGSDRDAIVNGLSAASNRREKTRRVASAISVLHSNCLSQSCVKICFRFRRHFCDGRFAAFHQATFANDDVVFLLPAWIDIRVIDAACARRGFPFGPAR